MFQPFFGEYTLDELFIKDNLRLNGMGLDSDSIPVETGLLSHLKKLYLHNNKLTSIPKELGNLSQLKRLYLSSNNLTIIPKELGNLSQLKRLHLSNNNLISIPKELGNLQQLEGLYLSSNNMLPQSEIDKVRKMLPNCAVYF